MGALPLEGIRVVAFTTGAAGPTVAKQFGEFGAQVINVESRVHPDTHRGGANQARWNKSPTYIKLHRNKLSFTLNLNHPKGIDLVKRLIRVSDVVVENFSLGVLQKRGLDYPSLRALKEDIIMLSLRGLGSTGPHARHVTWGPNLTTIFGMTYLWNFADSPFATAEARAQHPDFMSGVAGAVAVLAALLYRERSGKGQYIDGAQVEAGAALFGPLYLDYLVNGRDPTPVGNAHPAAAPHNAYPCRPAEGRSASGGGEDKWCVIAVYSDAEWRRLCQAMGDPPWSREPRFSTHLGRVQHAPELDALLESWTRELDPYQVMERLQAAGVMAGVVQDVEDQFQRDLQYRERGFLVELTEPELGPMVTEGVPVRLSQTPGAVRSHAPLLGEHTEYVCKEVLKLGEEEYRQLLEEGVLY